MKLGEDIKAVWVASVPRCGSMWTFNVARQIVRAAGCHVLPENVPKTDEEMFAAAEDGMHDPATDRVRVLKVHAVLRPDVPHSRFILPRRDVRDSMMSYMRFMRRDFEAGLEFVQGAIRVERHYDAFPRDRALPVDYADIVARPAEVVNNIATFFEAPVDRNTAKEIVSKFSKGNVARVIERKERDLAKRRRDGRPIEAQEMVIIGMDNVRAFDTETGFQSGHVSKYRDGDWERLLTPEQKVRLEAVIRASAPPPR